MKIHASIAAVVLGLLAGRSSGQEPAAYLKIELASTTTVSMVVARTENQTNAIPEPPVAEAAEPKRVLRYFCRSWKDENFKAMYGAMSASYRKSVTLAEFETLFASDIEANGGLEDENIEVVEVRAGAGIRLKVQLIFRSKSVKPKRVVAEVIKTPKGYRVVNSGILPLDLNQL